MITALPTNMKLTLAALLVAATAGCVGQRALPEGCTNSTGRVTGEVTSKAGTIDGTVYDLANGSPVGNLKLTLIGNGASRRTASDGTFRFDSVRAGRYVLVNDSAVYVALHDTVQLTDVEGLKTTWRVNTRRNLLRSCPVYMP